MLSFKTRGEKENKTDERFTQKHTMDFGAIQTFRSFI